jgi:hypothetical protein
MFFSRLGSVTFAGGMEGTCPLQLLKNMKLSRPPKYILFLHVIGKIYLIEADSTSGYNSDINATLPKGSVCPPMYPARWFEPLLYTTGTLHVYACFQRMNCAALCGPEKWINV